MSPVQQYRRYRNGQESRIKKKEEEIRGKKGNIGGWGIVMHSGRRQWEGSALTVSSYSFPQTITFLLPLHTPTAAFRLMCVLFRPIVFALRRQTRNNLSDLVKALRRILYFLPRVGCGWIPRIVGSKRRCGGVVGNVSRAGKRWLRFTKFLNRRIKWWERNDICCGFA